jgi:hypothetical protein
VLAPWLLDEAAAAGAAAGSSITEVLERCDAALTPGGGSTARSDELADAAAYFIDAGATLAAFARAAPQAVPAMLGGEGASLLPALAALHDRVCPAMVRAAPLLASAAGRAQAAAGDACAALLQAAYLAPRGGGDAARAARREGLFLLALACGAADASAGGTGLLRSVGSAPGFRAALEQADLALDGEQRDVVHAAFIAADASPAVAAAASADPGLASRIAAVRDVLPDLGDGFVAACLAALGGEPERVVHAVLEGALPPSVARLDRAMRLEQPKATARQAPPPRAAQPATQPTPPMPRPVAAPVAKLQALPRKGERNRWERDEGVQLLNERDVDAAAAALARASVFEEEEFAAVQAAAGFDAYDDEYDDTFDDLPVHVSEAATDADGDGDADAAAVQPVARPAGRPAPPAPAKRPQASAAAGGRQSKFWLLDGKVYSYAKAGAEVVTAASADEAARVATARAAASAALIHGLGAGGNRGPPDGDASGSSSSDDEDGGQVTAAGGAPGGGRGRGRGGPPDGARARARKDQNKAAVGNHHRKDRAANKQRALLGPT